MLTVTHKKHTQNSFFSKKTKVDLLGVSAAHSLVFSGIYPPEDFSFIPCKHTSNEAIQIRVRLASGVQACYNHTIDETSR